MRRLLLVLLAGLACFCPAGASAQAPELVSLGSADQQGNANSGLARASADGRIVAFQSDASNLVPGDTNGVMDIFVRDRQARTTTRVSVDSAGREGDGASFLGAVSADGRFVAFGSHADNLVVGDRDFESDVFVHDRLTGVTELVSVNSAGQQQNGTSAGMDISADGRFVAFVSFASNLVPGDTNGQGDVFVRDRLAGTTGRVSLTSTGGQQNGPAGSLVSSVGINGDGRFVAFDSFASNLVSDDTNGTTDVFVRDRATGVTERADVSSAEAQAQGGALLEATSDDGSAILFDSGAPNLVPGDTNDPNQPDVFVRDLAVGQTERVSVGVGGVQANAVSFGAAISADGRVVAFSSDASNLVAGDTNGFFDAFVHDRIASTTTRISLSGTGAQGNGGSGASAITADGTLVIFESGASNLVAGDANDASDIFARQVAAVPASKEDCMHGGWRTFGVFKNQGDCVSFVATKGKKPPAH
jgi:Tol biopolymer transport system component